MSYSFILVILVIGLSGIVAQVLLLRELLVSFYGNELTIGIILANWTLAEALGAFALGKAIEKFKHKGDLFIGLQLVFSLLLPFAIYFSRTFKNLLGIRFGEIVGINTAFWASLCILLPVAFCHGALFSVSCKIYSAFVKRLAHPIGRVYTWETIGTIIGGTIVTFFFIPKLNSFQAVFVVSAANLLVSFVFFKLISRAMKIALSLVSAAGIIFVLSSGVYHLQQNSISAQWQGQMVLDYANSVYGNIAVTRSQKQQTFFYNGLPAITTPFPDLAFVQDFGNLPLLFHPAPKKLLILGGGAGGIIREALKHPLQKIDYAELDPLLIKMVEKYPSNLTRLELTDKRVKVIYSDGRYVVKHTPERYDLILIGVSRISDLLTNRLFTEEFFVLAKKKLEQAGLLSFCLPGSTSALSPELRDFNASILSGLEQAYRYVRVIPGDYNIFLASDAEYIVKASPAYLQQRISHDSINIDLFVPGYLNYRLNTDLGDWFSGEMKKAAVQVNRDFRPFALFEMLVIWSRQFSPGFGWLFGLWRHFNLALASVMILLLTGLLFLRAKSKRGDLAIAYSIATTGFFGMLASLVLIFSFQIFHGYLYYRIGIFIGIFMAGIALGSTLMIRNISRVKNGLSLLSKIEAAIAGFSLLLAWMIIVFMPRFSDSAFVFAFLVLISGGFVGAEFALAGKLYSSLHGTVGEAAGLLYFSDLIGAWAAGIFGSVIFLPVLGLWQTCVIMALLKLSSLCLLKTSFIAKI